MGCRRLISGLIGCLIASGSLAGEDFRTERIVSQERSIYRNILVMEGEGYRCLQFGRYHARQSCMRLDQPEVLVLDYTQGLLTSLALNAVPRRVLVIGLGGGILPMALRRLDPNVEIDVIELDPAVIRVAKSHFGFREDPRLRMHDGDGRVFVRRQGRKGVKYDVVIIDAFDRDYIPEHMLTVEFLQEVKSVLAPDGLIAANTFTQSTLARHELATYQRVFDATYSLALSSGNRILFAGPPSLHVKAEAAVDRSNLHAFRFMRFGMPINLLAAQIHRLPTIKGARVLTDQYSPSNLM